MRNWITLKGPRRLINKALLPSRPYYLALVSILSFISICVAQTPTKKSLEELVVIAHFHVISFTTWESIEKLDNIVVCIDIGHPLGSSLESTFSGQTTKNRTVSVETFDLENLSLEKCHVVILSGGQKKNSTILKKLANAPVLTMTSVDDITEYDGMVYVRSGKTPKFNLGKLKETKIRIDSSLLAISEIINGG